MMADEFICVVDSKETKGNIKVVDNYSINHGVELVIGNVRILMDRIIFDELKKVIENGSN